MTIFKQISLCAILLFALASVGFAQELTTHEKSVKVVRAPSGSLELNPTDARVAEIEAARAIRLKTEIEKLSGEYKGKTFWFWPEYVPLKVVDIIVAADEATFVFQKMNGERFTDRRLPSDVYYTRDPRQIFPARVWAFIKQGKVVVGMTKDQALASWGEPETINRTLTRGGVSEQWVYGLSSYLYFTNGRLTAAQN